MPNGVVPGPGERAEHGVEQLRREIRLLQGRIRVLEQHHHSYIMEVHVAPGVLPTTRYDMTSVPCWPQEPEAEPAEPVLRFGDPNFGGSPK